MATKNYHRVIVNGFARYRVSPKTYVSYNIAKDSWSSKMLPGNVPVEIVAKPKVIKVRGEAWGEKVERSYMEGEVPVVATIAFKGIGPRTNWDRAKAALGKDSFTSEELAKYDDPADPNAIRFDSRGYTNREQCAKYVADIRTSIEKKKQGTLGNSYGYECNDVQLVELR